jgi:hypothetical protein
VQKVERKFVCSTFCRIVNKQTIDYSHEAVKIRINNIKNVIMKKNIVTSDKIFIIFSFLYDDVFSSLFNNLTYILCLFEIRILKGGPIKT